MEISLLCENTSSDLGCLAEWGFSAFISFEGVSVLFDTGYSDVYLHNAKKLDIDLENTNYIVLSHLFPMHCVDFPTLAKFHHLFGSKKYSAGDVIALK